MSLYQVPHQQNQIKCRQPGLGIMTGQLWRLEMLDTSASGFKCPLACSTFVSNEILKMWGKPIHLREGTAKSSRSQYTIAEKTVWTCLDNLA